MGKKDIAAIAALPLGDDTPTYESKARRKIDGGYITTETKDGPGGYTSREYFSRGATGEGKGSANGPNEHRGSLAEAASYLKGK